MADISLDTVVGQSGDPVTAEIDGKTVMMNIERGSYYGLDDIGSRIWALMEQPRTVSSIVDALLDEYEVDRAACERDVLVFLNGLAKEGLLAEGR